MEDIEVVLRFFALRHMKHYKYGIQGFLDLYMIRSKAFTDEDIEFFKRLFDSTLNCAHSIYGDHIFKIYEDGRWTGKSIKGMYDAIMVPLSEFPEHHNKLANYSSEILSETIKLFEKEGVSALTGRASTKKDLENRIDLFRRIFKYFIAL